MLPVRIGDVVADFIASNLAMISASKRFIAALWALTKPYWFAKGAWAARLLLAAIIALNLGIVYVNVLINHWNNDFYNTLQNMDKQGFFHQLLIFSGLAAAYIVIAVYQRYLNQMLQIRWRRWLTERYLADWTGDLTYYRLQLTDRGTDNPDQRIADDLAAFCDKTLELTLGFLSSVVTLVSFATILWTLSGTLSLPLNGGHISVPGYMLWAALLYAIAGTALAHRIGNPLVALNFNQQKFEANFRFSLVRIRENAEAIALYAGEANEVSNLRRRFSDIVDNWWAIMKRQKALTWFRAGYNQIGVIFPFLVGAPRYFAGSIHLGGLMQTASAFGQVQDALSWFVNAYTQLAEWRATVERLTTFRNAAHDAHVAAQTGPGILVTADTGISICVRRTDIELPGGQPLLDAVDFELKRGEKVLITGASGSGKSTLFRVMAGIWPFGHGKVTRPPKAQLLFLPQKPYLTVGSLRDQLCYPEPSDRFNDTDLKALLRDCGLQHLVDHLGDEQHWAQLLSGGEQQRVAIARALLHKPDWLFMDEATSALDERSESSLYRVLNARLPHSSIISIGHRSSLAQFHQRRIEIDAQPGDLKPRIATDRTAADKACMAERPAARNALQGV